MGYVAFAAATIPILKGLRAAAFPSFPCFVRVVSLHEAAGLSFTHLLVQKPGWSGHFLGDAVVMVGASRPIIQEYLTPLLRRVYFVATCNPLSKASHGLSLSIKQGGVAKTEMCNIHYGEGQRL